MADRYGVTEDWRRNARTKLHHMLIWEGTFSDQFVGYADELPRHDGYMITLEYAGKIRVTCPAPRNDDNWQEVDAAINAAIDEHYMKLEGSL